MPRIADAQTATSEYYLFLLEQMVTTFRRIQKSIPEVDNFDPTVDPLLTFYEDLIKHTNIRGEQYA